MPIPTLVLKLMWASHGAGFGLLSGAVLGATEIRAQGDRCARRHCRGRGPDLQIQVEQIGPHSPNHHIHCRCGTYLYSDTILDAYDMR